MGLFNKIDLRDIIHEHFNTLYDNSLQENRDNDNKKKSKGDLFVFIGLPVIFGFLLSFFTVEYELNFSETFLISLSIFIPIMFSVLSIIYSLSQKKLSDNGFRVLKEFKANVVFTIFVSMITILFLIIQLICVNLFQNPLFLFELNKLMILNELTKILCLDFHSINFIISFIIYVLLLNIGLTMLMILQRFDYVMNQVLNNKN